MQDRVRYFSKEDLSLSYYLRIAEGVVDDYANGRIPEDVNDYLEMFEIIQFKNNGIVSDKWDDETIACISEYKSLVARFLNSLTPTTIVGVYASIDPFYTEVFWEAIDQFGIKNILNINVLRALFAEKSYALRELLECNRIVSSYNGIIAELLRQNEHTAEWLLAAYVEDDRLGNQKKIYIPSSLTIDEKDKIICDYIDSPKANLNYLRLIVFTKNSKDFKISDKTRLKAQQKEREQNKRVLSEGHAMKTSYTVCMTEDKDAPVKDGKLENGHNPIFTYNSIFLRKQDPAGLMSYCAQVFEFTTRLGFITLVSKQSDNGLMERLFSISAHNAYPTTVSFNFSEAISWMQTEAMQNVLHKDGRSIEGMLKKFYETYLPDRLGYKGLELEFAKEDDSWKQKCLVLLPLIENISKQYTTFTENGKIDAELVSIMSPMKVTDIPSSITKKYYVINGTPTELWRLFHLFFSDQCMLTFVEPYKDKHYRCFFDLISKENSLSFDNYEKYQQNDIEFLCSKGFLSKTGGRILLEKPKDVLLLKQLYEYHACPYWYYDSVTKGVINEMVEEGWLVEDNHLLTPMERDYFSYYLNNEKFTNGPALRNRYMHGAIIGASESEHRKAYFRILNLFVLLTLKIFEDLSMMHSLESSKLKDSGYKVGNIVRLQDIASVQTYDQINTRTKLDNKISFVSIPKDFGYGRGLATIENYEVVKNGYAILPHKEFLTDFIAFYMNSGIARVALLKCNIEKHEDIMIDDLRDLPLSVIPKRYQVACVLFDALLGTSFELYNSEKKDKTDVMRRDLLIQMREFICMEIMNPVVTHNAGITLLDPTTNLIADVLDISDSKERLISFVDRIVYKDDFKIMSIIKRSRVAAQKVSEELNIKEA